MNLIYSNSTLIKSSGDVYPKKSIPAFYIITISLPVKDTSEQRRQHLRYYKQVSFGLLLGMYTSRARASSGCPSSAHGECSRAQARDRYQNLGLARLTKGKFLSELKLELGLLTS